MVFRAMVRDDARFYDRSDWWPRGRNDFQTEGQLMPLRHALHHMAGVRYSPDHVISGSPSARQPRVLLVIFVPSSALAGRCGG
jgi:hypothetical protein